jgi:hypothetical protein
MASPELLEKGVRGALGDGRPLEAARRFLNTSVGSVMSCGMATWYYSSA